MRVGDRSDDDLMRVLEAFKEHGGNMTVAADALGMHRDTFRKYMKEAAKRGLLGTKPILEGFEIKQTSAQMDADGNVQKQWVQQRPSSGPAFEMPEGHFIKGVSALTDENGNVRAQWIKTQLDTTQDYIEAIRKAFDEYKGASPLVPAPTFADDDVLTVYPIADLHLGMLSWGKETGSDYDLAIAEKLLCECLSELIAQSRPSRRAIILNLGDWQHTDDQKNMTPRSGNLLDVDSRYQKILFAGAKLQMQCAEMALRKHNEVEWRNLKGNHDPHVAIALTLALKCFYENNPRLTVDDRPGEFYFRRFGKSLIGAHHGHRAKSADLAMKMATDQREDWGQTDYHYFYKGHIHHETAKEVGDVRVESFQTIAPKDAHASDSGYTSGRSLTAITIHRERGEIGRHRVNIPADKK